MSGCHDPESKEGLRCFFNQARMDKELSDIMFKFDKLSVRLSYCEERSAKNKREMGSFEKRLDELKEALQEISDKVSSISLAEERPQHAAAPSASDGNKIYKPVIAAGRVTLDSVKIAMIELYGEHGVL